LKRDGALAPFDRRRIADAIFKAAVSVGGTNRARAEELADLCLDSLARAFPAGESPAVEEIQDVVEKTLIENGHARTAKAFILYREERRRARTAREARVVAEDNVPYKVLWKVLDWNVDHDCHTIEGLNRHLAGGTWPALIAAAEAAYQEDVRRVAGAILKRGEAVRLVIVAGPSSSGKTTTTLKIGECLAGAGRRFVLLTLDNYFKDLDQHPRDEYGDHDFETPQALDVDLINDHLHRLLAGRAIHMPFYDFKAGRRADRAREFRLGPGEILLLDSLHGLDPAITAGAPSTATFRFYIEALCQIKDTQGQFIRWADWRLLRRMTRDRWHRNTDPVRTVGHWHYVRRSEMRHIVPFIHTADWVFNGALPYELPYLKRSVFPYYETLLGAFRDDPQRLDAHLRARRTHEFLAALNVPGEDDAVPRNSLLREFIGGSLYEY
jgi:uridine kinase